MSPHRGGPDILLDGWLRTKQERSAAVVVVPLLAVVASLAPLGHEIAAELLVALGGGFIGNYLAYPITDPFRRRFVGRFGSWRGPVAYALGLATTLAVIFLGPYVVGIPNLLSEELGVSGAFVLGFAFGFGGALRRLARTPEEERVVREAGVRLVLVVAGAAAGLSVLLFAVFVLIERVVAPVVGHLAA